MLRLLDSSLGGQAGWLLGFALVAGLGIAVASRLRRADERTGWLIVVGGAALTCAVAFSAASGIFHPYYVSQLAPFAAALVGAGVGQILGGGVTARVIAALAIAGGVATTLAVLHNNPGQLEWLPPVLVTAGVLADRRDRAARRAPPPDQPRRRPRRAVHRARRVGDPDARARHPGDVPRGRPHLRVRRRLRRRSRAACAAASAAAAAAAPARRAGRRHRPRARRHPARPAAPPATARAPNAGGRGGGGGLGGGDSQSITAALTYIKAHGGGTLAVSSQNGGASSTIIESGADVVAIGGFSGRESQVSADWLADRVESGEIRYVLTTGGGGGPGGDSRVGSSDVMAKVADTGRAVSSVSGLYDVAGTAAELRS